jgi:hypothetical protein
VDVAARTAAAAPESFSESRSGPLFFLAQSCFHSCQFVGDSRISEFAYGTFGGGRQRTRDKFLAFVRRQRRGDGVPKDDRTEQRRHGKSADDILLVIHTDVWGWTGPRDCFGAVRRDGNSRMFPKNENTEQKGRLLRVTLRSLESTLGCS